MFHTDKKQIAVLIDPSNIDSNGLDKIMNLSNSLVVDFIFIGGSIISRDIFEATVENIKSKTSIPIILFPGNGTQISKHADAILFLSLISGRNAELLIGNHVVAAPLIRDNNLHAISVGYMLIDGGKVSSVQYMSNTTPIPSDKTAIAACTAIAGEMLGMKAIYLEAGSGAVYHVSTNMIKEVDKNISIPLIVGGGIRNQEQAEQIFEAGADIIVLGNILEKTPEMLSEIIDMRNKFNK